MYGREYVTPLDLTLDLPSNIPHETYTDYVEQFRNRLRAACNSVNTIMNAKTQRMKRAYDSRVHEIQLEPGSFAWYFCPRRKQGLYQKWRRLSEICYVEKRFTDVTYSIRTTPRAKPIIAHIDRLRKFEGEVPEIWWTMKFRITPSKSVCACLRLSAPGRVPLYGVSSSTKSQALHLQISATRPGADRFRPA